MRVLEENEVNYLIMTEDGSTETKTKSSNLNKLLFGHDLFGLLREGSEIWMNQGGEDEPTVTVIPDDNAECYTLRLSGIRRDLTLGEHHKTNLVDALASVYEDHDGESNKPLIDLYEDIRGDMVRVELVEQFRMVFGDKVQERDDGWYINGHLLLTYEGNFYHPENASRNRSGSVIGTGTSIEAYDLAFQGSTTDMSREVTFEGESYRLTESEIEFIAKAIWAIENTPDRRNDVT